MTNVKKGLFGRNLMALAAAGVVVGAASSASATLYTFTTFLDGPSESPANASPGVGFAKIDFDTTAHTMRIQAVFSGLLGTTTASHIHAATAAPNAGTAGVATQTPSFVGFPLGVTSGTMDMTWDMSLSSSYNAAFITANGGTPLLAETALVNAALGSKAYLNIHSSVFGGGEIRGFLPSPGAAGLLGLGGLVAMRRRR